MLITYPWKRMFSSVVLSDFPFNKLNGPQRSLTFPFPVSNLPLPQIQFWHPTYLAKILLSKRQPLPNQASQLPHSSIPYLLTGEELYRASSTSQITYYRNVYWKCLTFFQELQIQQDIWNNPSKYRAESKGRGLELQSDCRSLSLQSWLHRTTKVTWHS